MKKLIFEGYLNWGSDGEEKELLVLDGYAQTLAELMQEIATGKTATVRYYVSEKKIATEEAEERYIRNIKGEVEAFYGKVYSQEMECELFKEDIQVGGHDLLHELKSYIGKHLILSIEIEEEVIPIKVTTQKVSEIKEISSIEELDSRIKEIDRLSSVIKTAE